MRRIIQRTIGFSIERGKVYFFVFCMLLVSFFYIKAWYGEWEFYNIQEVFLFIFRDAGYIPELSEYTLPVAWLFVHTFSLGVIAYVVHMDIEENGIYLFIRTLHKQRIYHSIYISIFILSFLYTLLLAISLGGLLVYVHGAIGVGLSVLLMLWLRVCITIFLINVLCFILFMITNTNVSILVSVMVLLAATVFNNNWLLGSQSLPMKQIYFTPLGLPTITVFCISLGYGILLYFVGYYIFMKKEF